MDIRAALAQLAWLGEGRLDAEVTELPGGLTNHNFRVRTGPHDVVVRLSSADTGLLGVDRDHEWRNSRAAATAGVGAPVLDYLPGKGVLVVGFLPGRTYAAHDVRANLPRVAASLRRLHSGPEFAGRFDMFAIQQGYAEIVRERGLRVPDGYERLAEPMRRVRLALQAHPDPLVPCHNDLLAANFLDDGTGDGPRIVDYEYSGTNEAAFELGNLACECQLGPEHLGELVAAYHGRVSPRLLARAELFGLAGQWGWTLWGAIQHGVSDLEADFWEFATERLEPAARLVSSPRLEQLIDAAAGEGP